VSFASCLEPRKQLVEKEKYLRNETMMDFEMMMQLVDQCLATSMAGDLNTCS
jgi:hypothetical protein